MTQFPNDASDWYEDDDQPFEAAETETKRVPGLPGSWKDYIWWIAVTVFALIWVFDSVSAFNNARGFSNYSEFASNMWNLFLVMLLAYLLYKVSRPYIRSFAYVLSGSAAVYVLLTHTF